MDRCIFSEGSLGHVRTALRLSQALGRRGEDGSRRMSKRGTPNHKMESRGGDTRRQPRGKT